MKHLPFTIAIIAIVILAGMLAVSAAESVLEVPSKEQRAACDADARRLCGPYLKSPIGVVRACMIAHLSQISPSCLEAFK